MKLSAPKFVVFLICVIAFLLGVFGPMIGLTCISALIPKILIYGSFVLLALACMFKGL